MKPPAFQFYADDFLAGTFSMSNEERGFYITLICRQWTQGHVTPDEVARLGSTVSQPSINHVLTKFQPDADGNLKNARLEVERAKQSAFRELQSAKGKASAQARFNRGSTVVQPSQAPKGNSPVSVSVSSFQENTSKTLGEPATPPAPTTKPKALKVARTDADLIASYASNPAYRGIDVTAQLHKMRAWCAVNRKEPTERRFVNWLNRTDKPLGGDPLNGALMR